MMCGVFFEGIGGNEFSLYTYCTTRWNIVVFDCMCNTLNYLLLNQHNEDDAPQNVYSMYTLNNGNS